MKNVRCNDQQQSSVVSQSEPSLCSKPTTSCFSEKVFGVFSGATAVCAGTGSVCLPLRSLRDLRVLCVLSEFLIRATQPRRRKRGDHAEKRRDMKLNQYLCARSIEGVGRQSLRCWFCNSGAVRY